MRESLRWVVWVLAGFVTAGCGDSSGNGIYLDPIHLAGFEGRAHVVEKLLEAGGDIGAVDELGLGVIHWTVLGRWTRESGHSETLKIVIAHGADVDLRDRTGHTPLHHAARRGNSSAVLDLIAAGADCGAANVEGWTPLMAGVLSDHEGTIRALLGHSNPDIRNNEGKTAAAIASERGLTIASRVLGAETRE